MQRLSCSGERREQSSADLILWIQTVPLRGGGVNPADTPAASDLPSLFVSLQTSPSTIFPSRCRRRKMVSTGSLPNA